MIVAQKQAYLATAVSYTRKMFLKWTTENWK
jgi:hypothetical protein